MKRQRIVILTGAGMSAESGISTFRDADGLWENHRIEDVASPEGWARNQKLVLDFYNTRRQQLKEVKPNKGHLALKKLETVFKVDIITQNVDDLHERAGSTNIIHLHGELKKVRSVANSQIIYEWSEDLNVGDTCEKGFQMRPHIVWFGEAVPMLEPAAKLVQKADIILIIGTSMQVYPAAGLSDFASQDTLLYYIDPDPQPTAKLTANPNATILVKKATIGVPELVDQLLNPTIES